MDLITAEIKALQTRCSRVDRDNEALRRCNAQRDNEIDLLNKYVLSANQLIARLAQLVNAYETTRNNGANNSLVDTAKCMVKRDQLALSVCSKQLSHWRKTHKKTAFDNAINCDHTYATSVSNNNNNNNNNSAGDHCSSPQFLVIPKTEPIDDFSDLDALCQLSPNSSVVTNQLNLMNKNANDFLLATEFFKSYIVNDKNSDGITVTVNRPTEDDIKSALLSPTNVLNINLNEDSQNQLPNDNNDLEPFNGLAGDSVDNCGDLAPIALPRNVSTTTTKKKRQNYFTKSNAKWEKRGELFRCLWKGCHYENRMKANLMKHHSRCHARKDIHKCQHCSKRFTNIKILRSHLRAHRMLTDITPHNNNNNRRNKSADGFVRRGSGNLRCPMPNCSHKYINISHIWRHMRSVHGSKCYESVRRQYERERSSDSSISSHEVIDQIRIRRNADYLAKRGAERTVTVTQNEFPCDYVDCQSSYNTKASLKRHQMSFHKRLSKVIFGRYAGQPGYRFFIPRNNDSNAKLMEINKNGVNSIRNAVTKQYDCPTTENGLWLCEYKGCGRYYCSNSNLNKHQRQKHGRTEPNKSNNASETCKSVSHSSSPVKNQRTSDKRIFKCVVPQCGACFIYEKNLNSHMKNKHNTGGDANPKSKWNTSSVSCSSRSSSVAGDDSDESFECPYMGCEFVARNKISFMRHYNAHFKSEDKPFKCVIVDCNYESNHLRGLRNHVLNKHSEQQFLRAMERTGIQYPLYW